jgi:hypothetical protein
MSPALLQPFLAVALPIIIALAIASWANNSRLSDMRADFNRRLDEILGRLDRIERKLDNHEERIVRLEERTSLVARRV